MTPNGTPRTGLARALSKLGFSSRSAARKLIADRRVRLNGRLVRDPENPVRLGVDRIEVDGEPVRAAKKVYLMLNKPRGIVTTAHDEHGRETVYSLLPEYRQWVAPVGRLDKASEGLLLLTNDSEWSARIASPETHLDKTYHVQIGAIADDALLQALTAGLRRGNGDLLVAKRAALLRHGGKNSWIEIVLDEGKNRQIRRMLGVREIEVLRLIRVAIGPLKLGDLPGRTVRKLTRAEKQALDKAAASPLG
jgi:23S rRNA pseudouridine2605 synthase